MKYNAILLRRNCAAPRGFLAKALAAIDAGRPADQHRYLGIRTLRSLAIGAALIFATSASAQQPAPLLSYGSPGVTLEQARKAVQAVEAEAAKNGWRMAIVVVTNEGDLILFNRMDDTQFGSSDVAIRKAKTAAAFRRPTKVFQDAVNATRRRCRS
jgi:Haem-degrading